VIELTSSGNPAVRLDRAGVIQLVWTDPLLQRLSVHGHRDVGSLARHRGSIGEIQPPAADLPQGIGPPLGGGSLVGLT
jgi:hypothetical protein